VLALVSDCYDLCMGSLGSFQKVFPLRPWMPLTCANAPLKVACKSLAWEGEGKCVPGVSKLRLTK
jgi:hypothetical protein